tara:strand:- start:12432 stop:14369 length:1938 start_codon:yes stop_codon:yes gene_type:complete
MCKNIILALVLSISFLSIKAQELMNISGESVTIQEFKNTLMKNNNDKEITKEYLDSYVDLFINYKLKVLHAKELQLDKEAEFISELEGYRKQLAKPYLQAQEFKEELINEAYDRMKYDINASHILFRLDENSLPSDTLLKYKLAQTVKQRIESRELTFAQAVKEYSDEDYNNGNLGYFTAFDMVYSFETAAYTTKVGSVSEIVRTQYGYHLLMVNDKRPSVGQVKVSHIMFRLPQGANSEQVNSIKLKIDEVHKKLEKGQDFALLADRFSEDRSTAVKGGILPWFGINKMAKEFEDASFSLKNIGDFTSPFKTDFGWHIVLLNDKKVLSSLEETKEEIKTKINKGSRSLLSELALLRKIKKEYNFTENIFVGARKNNIKGSLDLDKLKNAQLTKEDIKKSIWDNLELFKLDGIVYTQQDFKDFILEQQEVGLDFDLIYDRFVDFSCLEYEERNLEEKYPDYKILLNEFRDGILLFELTSKLVWTKAMEDTLGLQNYYNNNLEKYWWDERVEANIYTCANSKVLNRLKRMLSKKKEETTTEHILDEINKNNPLNLQVSGDKYSKGDNKFVDKVEWQKGIYVLETTEEAIILVEVLKLLPSEQKKLSDTKGKVIADYQTYLENTWLTELRRKYRVTVNQEVLYSIIK